ncbi:hypothetical protein FQR65_LT06530 [Abscondita terminalis]|nr:hypothetical protein FQR65_LT06530 [Abscondita terminalis]
MLDKQIISEKSLRAVQELIAFLKQNVRRRDVFHAAGHDQRVQQIVHELERGGPGLRNLFQQGWIMESAAGLQIYLRQLRKPLIPHHIQALALDDNPGVCPEIVAQDILGLLRQDVEGRHFILITSVLDLLYCILKQTPTDELTGCNIPISMLPVFFNMQTEHIIHWRRIATVFVELIRMAPSNLNFPVEDEFIEDGYRLIPNVPVVNNNLGHQGDATGFEIVPTQRRITQHQRPLSNNSLFTLHQ